MGGGIMWRVCGACVAGALMTSSPAAPPTCPCGATRLSVLPNLVLVARARQQPPHRPRAPAGGLNGST
eukprot:4555211-Prymnesium_polylepis.1